MLSSLAVSGDTVPTGESHCATSQSECSEPWGNLPYRHRALRCVSLKGPLKTFRGAGTDVLWH